MPRWLHLLLFTTLLCILGFDCGLADVMDAAPPASDDGRMASKGEGTRKVDRVGARIPGP